MKNNDERTLVLQFRDAHAKKEAASNLAKAAAREFEIAESELIEAMETLGIEATACYEGVGYVRLKKPRLYASCVKENEEELFNFLMNNDRSDLIRPTVNSQSLSAYVSELVLEGKLQVPPFISYYMKKSAQLY